MVTGYKFGEMGRREQPAALQRLNDPQVKQTPRICRPELS